MFKVWSGVSLVLALALGAAAAVQQTVNASCPIKGSAVKPGITSDYKGKKVGFCCGNCKGKFDSAPDSYISAIPELAPPTGPASLESAEAALKAGKENKPAVILFADSGPKTELFLKILSDASLAESLAKVAYAKVEFKKDSEDAKKFKVTAAPTLVIIDNTKDEPKVIKAMQGGTPKSIKKELDDAAKKLEKK